MSLGFCDRSGKLAIRHAPSPPAVALRPGEQPESALGPALADGPGCTSS